WDQAGASSNSTLLRLDGDRHPFAVAERQGLVEFQYATFVNGFDFQCHGLQPPGSTVVRGSSRIILDGSASSVVPVVHHSTYLHAAPPVLRSRARVSRCIGRPRE